MKARKIAIVTTHPVQYQAPWFRACAACPELDVEVFFCHQATAAEQAGAGFGIPFEWDVPLLEGYRYRFLRNQSARPGLKTFGGLDTPEIGGIVARERFDAVIVNGWHYKSAWQTLRACWASRTPVMVRGDSHLHTPRHPLKTLLKAIPYRWFIPRLDACLAAGTWSTDYFLHYGARREKIFLVPHGIDEARFSAESARLEGSRGQLRRRWKLPSGDVVFLFVGKFIPEKRPLDFVRAVHLAALTGARVSGLMVGDGPLRAACEEFVGAGRVPVGFAGFLNQSQITAAYAACDVLVLPSEGETWGLVVNEAMASHRPCIVSDRVGCGPDLVSEGSAGFVFPRGDVKHLAGLMIRCAEDRDGLLRMSRRAPARVARFSSAAAVAGMLEALSSGARPGGVCA